MPTYDYSAYDAKGKLVDGVVTADSERQARRQLKEKKLLASKITEVSKSSSKSKMGGRAKVNDFDLSLVLQQQAILIQSGLPLEDAMRMTIEQAETDRQRRMVESWRSEIIEGRSFSEAMRRSPYKIPESVIAGVGVGEESGHLHTVLMRLAEDIETSAENRKTVSRAMVYPATLLGASMLVVSMMMVWVVPKITAIFISSNRELPTITKVIMAVSDFVQQYGLMVVLLAILLAVTVSWLLKDTGRRTLWHQMILNIPGLGRWTTMANIADWSRSLGVLLGNGVPALVALKISSSVCLLYTSPSPRDA